MGIDVVTAKFLVFCCGMGVDFSETLTLGRQSLYVDKYDFADFLTEFDIDFRQEALFAAFKRAHETAAQGPFAEEIFTFLGARRVEAMDASAYEGASFVHDMNNSIPSGKNNAYTVVLDGGTLEHVFNFPVAIENCMRLLKKGGHFISVAPANNFFGHGFYQFSSELFFRIFCKENGFFVKKVFLVAERPFSAWYEIQDPASLGRRVALRNQVPTFQLFVAEKIDDHAGLNIIPQQSDYASILWTGGGDGTWTAHGAAATNRRRRHFQNIIDLLPRSFVHNLKAMRMIATGSLTPPFRHSDLRRFQPKRRSERPSGKE